MAYSPPLKGWLVHGYVDNRMVLSHSLNIGLAPKPPELKSTLCLSPQKIGDKVEVADRERITAKYFRRTILKRSQ
jgi:hypothetical protein